MLQHRCTLEDEKYWCKYFKNNSQESNVPKNCRGGWESKILEGESFSLTMSLITRNILHGIFTTFLGNIIPRKHDSMG